MREHLIFFYRPDYKREEGSSVSNDIREYINFCNRPICIIELRVLLSSLFINLFLRMIGKFDSEWPIHLPHQSATSVDVH